MAQATLFGPQGIKIILDTDEVIPDDPGQGTPAIVQLGDFGATYWYAIGTGQVYNSGWDRDLTDRQLSWLQGKEAAVNRFLYH
jgi:hypothetical protein